MFTGIIHNKSEITKLEKTEGGLLLTITDPKWEVALGDSITINGVCSTAKSLENGVTFEYMPESLQKTTLLKLEEGQKVNTEKSLTLQQKLDGHMVVGHVDTTGEIISIEPEGNSFIFTIQVEKPDEFMELIAKKGSVCIDGISLTVVDVNTDSFTVKIVPYTIEQTNLGELKVGAHVNLEFDLLAKYVARILDSRKS